VAGGVEECRHTERAEALGQQGDEHVVRLVAERGDDHLRPGSSLVGKQVLVHRVAMQHERVLKVLGDHGTAAASLSMILVYVRHPRGSDADMPVG